MVVLLWVIFVLVVKITLAGRYSDWAKVKYNDSFQRVCMKYEWVKLYLRRQQIAFENVDNINSNQYAIFVFDDHHKRARKGGLGDRLGGLITTFAFALRSNRTFLIEANDQGLGKLFQPYQSFNTQQAEKSYHTWWKDNIDEKQISNSNKTYLWCVNPKPSQTACALDQNLAYSQFQIMRVRTNRCYLCRWAQNSHLAAYQEIRDLLDISSETNLYEIAGCMLRLALYPTNHLWDELDSIFENYMPPHNHMKRNIAKPTPSNRFTVDNPTTVAPYVQVGFHYRCGDHNYNGALLHPEMEHHMQCAVQPGVPWNGTHAVDELSLASPIDSALCGKQVIDSLLLSTSTISTGSNGRENNPLKSRYRAKPTVPFVLAYVASDNTASGQQINDTLHHPNTFLAPTGCHIDYDHSAACSYTTLLYWFVLTMNDHSVYQSYFDLAENNAQLAASSFSRYAMIYSLQDGSRLHYAGSKHCNAATSNVLDGEVVGGATAVWNATVSRLPQGNWMAIQLQGKCFISDEVRNIQRIDASFSLLCTLHKSHIESIKRRHSTILKQIEHLKAIKIKQIDVASTLFADCMLLGELCLHEMDLNVATLQFESEYLSEETAFQLEDIKYICVSDKLDARRLQIADLINDFKLQADEKLDELRDTCEVLREALAQLKA